MHFFSGKEQFSIEEFEDKVEINPFKGIYESPMRRLDYQSLDVVGSPNDPDWKRKNFYREPLDPNKDYEILSAIVGIIIVIGSVLKMAFIIMTPIMIMTFTYKI